jgi:gamma-glutamylaminecyclotransferase
MCVIIIKQKGKQLAKDVAQTSARINPHGLGIIWLDTFEVSYHESKEFKVLDTDRPFIAHFRYATVGAINRDNTHPFRCGSNSNEWLMMNGTIKGLGNAEMSDSRELALLLGEIPRHTWKKELEKYECRFVTINTRNRTFQIYNQQDWVQTDGVWYSKANVLEKNLVAVYGTLKKGYSNYWSYLASSTHVGSGKTKDKYPLLVDTLPYLVNKRGTGHNVEVDVFSVSDETFDRLDRLERHPKWYRREQIDIKMKGKTIKCWIYFNPKQLTGREQMHTKYVQEMPKPWVKQYDFDYSWFDEPKQYKPKTYKPTQLDFEDMLEAEGEAEFKAENEKPICIDCYHDVEYDGLSNYHCSGCDGWFKESEVITFG